MSALSDRLQLPAGSHLKQGADHLYDSAVVDGLAMGKDQTTLLQGAVVVEWYRSVRGGARPFL
jgi:hypothetical protein